MSRPRHLGLQIKLTVALVLIVLLPLVASAILIDQIGKLAANYGATEARERAAMIEQVGRVYRDLVSTTKALQAEVAQRIAARPDILNPVPEITLDTLPAPLAFDDSYGRKAAWWGVYDALNGCTYQ